MGNHIINGIDALNRAMRDLDKRLKPGEGYFVQLWPDGSGHILKEDSNGCDKTIFSFFTTAELYAWLHADPKRRREMAALGRWREKREDAKLAKMLSDDDLERALREAAKPETIH